MTRARKFLRVSTGKQEEEKQVSDVIRYVEAKGYADDGRDYLAHGKSAYRGKHLPLLLEAIRDMADDQFDVLILWDSSRFTRMGAESIFLLMAKAREAGGRVEFAAPHAQAFNEVSGWSAVMLALQATSDKMESDRKREHTLREIRKHQEKGSIHGRPPWGFHVEGARDNKRFVPTEDGRRWIPWMYEQAINGRGGIQIARALTEAGVDGGKRWSEGVVNHVLRNPINHGYRRNGGNLETEPLVSFAMWQEAIAALESRWYGGRSAVKHPAPLVRPICGECYGVSRDGCANGLSVMYLHRYPERGAFYRCSGSGPLRKGCGGRMVPVDALDAIVLKWLSSSKQPHMARVFLPGTDTASELKGLNKAIAEAAARGDYEVVKTLSEKAAEASKAEGTRSRWEYVDSGISKGDYFRSLDREGQRAYIAESIILAERAEDGAVLAGEIILSEDGGAIVSRWV